MIMQDQIREMWHQADGIVVLAGAGMSVDSGLPDFRGSTGLWTQAKEDFIKLASAKGLESDPLQVWNFYIQRMISYGTMKPHSGYYQLLDLLQQHDKDHFVVTSNVDLAFHKAGYPAHKIHEIHGSLAHAQCAQACDRQTRPMPQFSCELVHEDEIPTCDKCGAILRPNVMMFSDPYLVWQQIDLGAAAYMHWCAPKLNVLGIEIGAGTQIPSIRLFGEERTSHLIRINPQESDVSRPQDVSIHMTALSGIDYLVKCAHAD